MEYKIYRKRLIIGMIIVAVIGTISHFVYDWSAQNKFVGLFFPVNESTWEHMKLAFFPMLLLSLCLYKETLGSMGYNYALTIGTLCSTWFIPVLYYSYKGILGFSKPWLDISTYYVSLLLPTLLMLHIAKQTGNKQYKFAFPFAIFLLSMQTIAFIIFTYNPLNLGIFSLI